MSQARRPAGTPVGGQFAPTHRPEAAGVELNDDVGMDEDGPKHLSDLDREDRVAALRSEIDRAMSELSSSEGWHAFLESRAKFHTYSTGRGHISERCGCPTARRDERRASALSGA